MSRGQPMSGDASSRAESDARAHVQQEIANRIRLWIDKAPVAVRDAADDLREDRANTDARALAAAATDDVVWDALAQVRQAIVLARQK